jgi:predicted HAD superfamily phosphohydrolase YqeG
MNIIKDISYIIINNHSNYKPNVNKDIVLFDLDDTIIKFNLKSPDYSLMFLNTIEKLKELSTYYTILIISNQKQLNKTL